MPLVHGAHILVRNISHVIKTHVKCGTHLGYKHQTEIKTCNSLPTLDKEQAGHYTASLLPRTRQCWGVKMNGKAHTPH